MRPPILILPILLALISYAPAKEAKEESKEPQTLAEAIEQGEVEIRFIETNGKNPDWKERDWQKDWVKKNGGQMEVVMPDGTRADIITEEYAIEVDWKSQWREGLAQAQHYAKQSKKKPLLLLVPQSQKDEKLAKKF